MRMQLRGTLLHEVYFHEVCTKLSNNLAHGSHVAWRLFLPLFTLVSSYFFGRTRLWSRAGRTEPSFSRGPGCPRMLCSCGRTGWWVAANTHVFFVNLIDFVAFTSSVTLFIRWFLTDLADAVDFSSIYSISLSSSILSFSSLSSIS